MSSSTPLFDFAERESGHPVDDLRLIEAGFPCHQVGAETQRERDTGKAPPTHRLHVWWARRPLTPSRAAILGATLPANTNVDEFLKALGIVKPVASIPGGGKWTLISDTILRKVAWDEQQANGMLEVDAAVQRHFTKEVERRAACCELLERLSGKSDTLANDPTMKRWIADNQHFANKHIEEGTQLVVTSDVADSAAVQDRIKFAKSSIVKDVAGQTLKIDSEDLYGYDRAFTSSPPITEKPLTILDPTAGGGSIPFEALRLGHNVISNELNPVATVIQYATLDFPRRFGLSLVDDIQHWGNQLVEYVGEQMETVTPFSELPKDQIAEVQKLLINYPDVIPQFSGPEYDQTGLIYYRHVTCPHCQGQAPLLNSFWLSKEDGDKWAVRLTVQSKSHVDITPYKITKPLNNVQSAELDAGTVTDGQGTCIHCRQVIDGDEIKSQARGESSNGRMIDRLYCVVSVRLEPKLKSNGELDRYTSGDRSGEIKTKKVRFFRAPNERDFAALDLAEKTLQEKWDHFERLNLIPSERIPAGHKTGDEGGAGSGTDKPLKLGTEYWHQMFTPRQLLGHLTLLEGLNALKPRILQELGEDRGKAVVTYLQFAIDKGIDYNSRQTRWEYTRGIVKGTFGRHDFSFKWTFGEMVFSGPNSGAGWGLSQITDAYKGIAELAQSSSEGILRIINGSGASLSELGDETVDLVVNDPPYYNNVMYSELADYFYVWMKRGLWDLYPELFNSYLTDKTSEAVANPFRDGSAENAKLNYETLMREMYSECFRVTKQDGLMVLMFTHKSQDGWETLTQALIQSGWTITATYPVDSESGHSMHIMETASAASSIFIVCRKRNTANETPALWKSMGGRGVQQRIVEEVRNGLREFEALDLRPVDTMVASYGRALRVLSEKWPVLDGDEEVSPIRALNEASRVVAQHQIHKLTQGRLKVEDLTPEAAMAVTLYGIAGLQAIRFDEVLNVARSLGIAIQSQASGYDATSRSIAYATEASGRRASTTDDVIGYHAPLVRRGSDLRLAKPEERNERRLSIPQHEWDVMQGMIVKYREGDIPVARAYLTEHAENEQSKIIDLLRVWTKEMDDETLRKEGEMILFGLQR
jgi:putative DNA methylase